MHRTLVRVAEAAEADILDSEGAQHVLNKRGNLIFSLILNSAERGEGIQLRISFAVPVFSVRDVEV